MEQVCPPYLNNKNCVAKSEQNSKHENVKLILVQAGDDSSLSERFD